MQSTQWPLFTWTFCRRWEKDFRRVGSTWRTVRWRQEWRGTGVPFLALLCLVICLFSVSPLQPTFVQVRTCLPGFDSECFARISWLSLASGSSLLIEQRFALLPQLHDPIGDQSHKPHHQQLRPAALFHWRSECWHFDIPTGWNVLFRLTPQQLVQRSSQRFFVFK